MVDADFGDHERRMRRPDSSSRNRDFWCVHLSHADDLRQMIKVFVSGVKHEIVLEHERREPDVIPRNRRTLLPQLAIDRCILMGSLIIGEQNAHPVPQQKPLQRPLVFRLTSTVKEPEAEPRPGRQMV
jgi:hypothetical protein